MGHPTSQVNVLTAKTCKEGDSSQWQNAHAVLWRLKTSYTYSAARHQEQDNNGWQVWKNYINGYEPREWNPLYGTQF